MNVTRIIEPEAVEVLLEMFSRRYVIEIILANELLKVGGDADVVVNRVEMRLNGVDA